MAKILDVLAERVLLCDGGFGALVQGMNLETGRDFLGCENCTDILNRSRPDVARDIHTAYFAAGADMVLTNTFGASPVTLEEFGLASEAHDLCLRAAAIAREAAERFKDGRERFVVGDVGPGTKLPSLGHIGYDPLEDAFAVQCGGLIAGGVDAILIETCQDPLQIKAAVNGAKRAGAAAGTATPIFVQVTVEATGTLLVGADIAAVATAVEALGVDLMGLNCATGPEEMAEHVRWLCENWAGPVSVQPNAGLPELVDGRARYPLTPEALAGWHERFVGEFGVALVGGCCGTTPDHIRAVNAMLERRAEGGSHRPRVRKRSVTRVPAAASLYSQVPLRQENAFFSIGERCNANGSKKFRELQQAGDWDGCAAMGREQTREGSHALDICTAYVGRDEAADMTEVVSRLRGAVTAPLVFDSTELGVLEAALKLYGGKAILNSINFEDGEAPAAKRLELARKFGAAVIALTIDETGMAKDADAKVRVARRLVDFACGRHGLAPGDLMIDPLTFTICTGSESDRRFAIETLEAIGRIRAEFPEVQIVLGVSNVSFGLKPEARHVLNSVFLDHAVRRGMTAAIVHVSKILPLHSIPGDELAVVEDLIFDRRSEDYDPLQAYMTLFSGRAEGGAGKRERPASVEERLRLRIVDGDRQGLDQDLEEALRSHSPLAIINTILLDGMKTVGELFGSGRMQLPFVLQSAETMKAAVAYLEPRLDKTAGSGKGTLVLATVKGDVHDIGKNLVDIILTNNGYKVVNLGIKQPVQAIIEAARTHAADAVGMSGLLVKSTVIMRENLEEMTRAGLDLPTFLGGAALTRRYVEEDCVKAYGAGRVAYARDAFDGLELMDKVMAGSFDDHLAGSAGKRPGRPARAAEPAGRPVDWEAVQIRRAELHEGVQVPEPPFWGPRLLPRIETRDLVPLLNETMLFQFHWGFKKAGRSLDEWKAWAVSAVRPILERMLRLAEAEDILRPAAAYGYWKCAADGDTLVLFQEDGRTEAGRFTFPRQQRPDGICLTDFFRSIEAGERDRDVVALQVVTAGQRASEVAREWFAADRYQDYLYLHGLSVEIAEAMAEYVHRRIRGELGIGREDASETAALLKQGYHGARYSFGYPACPNMADQRILLTLLGAERIGVAMAEEDQLHPEQSTSALVAHHLRARYFVV